MTPQAVRRNLFGRATEAALSTLLPVMRWLCVANFLAIYLFAQCSQPASSSYTSGVYTLSSSSCITATTIISGSASVLFESATSVSLEPGFDATAGTATTTFHAIIGTPVSITTTSLPSAIVGTSYSPTLSATGGVPPYGNWAVTSGSLPPGLSLNTSTGVISGAPTSSTGSPFSFSVTVTDSAGATSQPANLSIAICPFCYADFTLSAPSPSSQSVAQGYTSGGYVISAAALSGYTGIIGFAVTSGLPSGATASFSPASITNSGTTVLTITTGTSTPVGTSTLTITATSGAWGHVTAATLISATPPSITSLTPTSGTSGTQVTVSGSGFGSSRGTGAIWLGSTPGTIVSWSDTQIVATVASNSTSGSAQVRQNGAWSNAVTFNVVTAVISSVTPSSGLPGAQVTIAGSSFGTAQGTGQIWLGTANGLVQSWSDTQIVAVVANGSTSGSARVLQSGVWSNAISFTVNSLHITSVSPASGSPGASVTITGSGLGATQGAGTILLGSVNGLVNSWTDTQIVAVVAVGSVSGIARVQQNGLWSNALNFIVPGGTNTLVPNIVSMVVGDTRTIQALSNTGQPLTGLTWTSSDTSIVSLSTLAVSDPPILTALAPGHLTLTAGTASADITVYVDTLPSGTIIWSNPGNGSGVTKTVPAVPSATGVADIFAFQGDGTVQAITSDGLVAWTANASHVVENNGSILPDFQGGLVIATWDDSLSAVTIKKFDGLTGQLVSQYVVGSNDATWSPVVHTDGTIFVVMDFISATAPTTAVVGIDPATGTEKFRITQPGIGRYSDMIVAGDGYAYHPYSLDNGDFKTSQVKVLRVSSSGAYDIINVADNGWAAGPFPLNYTSNPALISNGDDGVLLSWLSPASSPGDEIPHLTKISSAGISDVIGPDIPGRVDSAVLLIQRQDGTFVGTIFAGPSGNGLFDWVPHMVAFDANGNVLWDVPNEQPMIATDDNGVIGWKGTIYDQNGAPIGTSPLKDYMTFDRNGRLTGQETVVQSWTLNLYQVGSVEQIFNDAVRIAKSWWPFSNGNASGNRAAVQQPWYAPLKSCPGASTPCPQEAIMSALTSLRALLGSSCSACQSTLNLLHFPGQPPLTTQQDFFNYLLKQPRFYDGSRSYVPTLFGVCRWYDPGCLAFYPTSSVHDYLRTTQSSAISQTPSYSWKGMQVFFDPPTGICNVASVNNPQSGDHGVLNQATLFHEALHGKLGVDDIFLETALGVSQPSANVTFHLEDNVIFRTGTGARSCGN